MNQEELRDMLVAVTKVGLSATAISKVTGIGQVDLSRFKNGQINLINTDAQKLKHYLEQVQIPRCM